MTVAVQQHIFGLKPTMDGLKISPCIPDEWEMVKIKRLFRQCVFDITIDNRARKGNTVKDIFVNDEKHCGNIVQPQGEGLQIIVVMG